jgi:hypothetical protein
VLPAFLQPDAGICENVLDSKDAVIFYLNTLMQMVNITMDNQQGSLCMLDEC